MLSLPFFHNSILSKQRMNNFLSLPLFSYPQKKIVFLFIPSPSLLFFPIPIPSPYFIQISSNSGTCFLKFKCMHLVEVIYLDKCSFKKSSQSIEKQLINFDFKKSSTSLHYALKPYIYLDKCTFKK